MKKKSGAGASAAKKIAEKNILPNLTKIQEPEPVFWSLGAGAARKKYQEPESRSRLGKKQEPEPEPLEKRQESRLPSPANKSLLLISPLQGYS